MKIICNTNVIHANCKKRIDKLVYKWYYKSIKFSNNTFEGEGIKW